MQCPLFEKERFVLAISILAIFLSLYAILFFIPNKSVQGEVVYLQKSSKKDSQPELYSLTSKIPLTLVSYSIEYLNEKGKTVSIIWKKETDASLAYFTLVSIYSNDSLFEKTSLFLTNIENEYGPLYTTSIFLLNQTPVFVMYPINSSSSLTVLYLWQKENNVYFLIVVSKGMEVEGLSTKIISSLVGYTPFYSSLIPLSLLSSTSSQNQSLFYCVEDNIFTCIFNSLKFYSQDENAEGTLLTLKFSLSEVENNLTYRYSYQCANTTQDLYKDEEGVYYSILPISDNLSLVITSHSQKDIFNICEKVLG